MIDSIYIGITGIQSHQERLTVIGNNVANLIQKEKESGTEYNGWIFFDSSLS